LNHINTMRLALDALTLLRSYTRACEGLLNASPAGQIGIADNAITALTAALAEPSEPVYIRRDQLQKARRENYLCDVGPEPRADKVAIYSNPPVNQPLTYNEIEELGFTMLPNVEHRDFIEFAQAIEALVRSKT
jgi:hypothetical protein